jgi:hypothetical protein
MARYPALALIALLLAAPVRADGPEQVLVRSDWTPPPTVEAAAARPALNRTVAAYLEREQGWVRLAHGGGARGSAWAHEVRAWLIALGIPGSHIRMDPGMADSGRLTLAVHAGGNRL